MNAGMQALLIDNLKTLNPPQNLSSLCAAARGEKAERPGGYG